MTRWRRFFIRNVGNRVSEPEIKFIFSMLFLLGGFAATAKSEALTSTGFTFGTISALFGLTNRIIDQTQYAILVTVVTLSAVVPTLFAQACFRPQVAAGPLITSEVPASPQPAGGRLQGEAATE